MSFLGSINFSIKYRKKWISSFESNAPVLKNNDDNNKNENEITQKQP